MKEAFEKMTGMPDAWTNPALMVSRNAFIQGWEAALAQPAQEPVAWMREDATLRFAEGKVFSVGQPFYTTPQQRPWVGLTDEEIKDAGRFSYCRGGTSEKLYHIMWNSQPSACIGWSREELIAFTKAVEAKYQEKNQ